MSLSQLLSGHLMGRIADEIAERADGSVLVTKDPAAPQRFSHRLVRPLARLLRLAAGEREAPDPEERTVETEVTTFPRPRR